MIELLHHEMMCVFVIENPLGASVIAVAIAFRDERKRSSCSAGVKAGDEPAGVAGELLHIRVGRQNVDAEAITVAESRIIHLQKQSRRLIEAFQTRGKVAQHSWVQVCVNDEVL